jgi:PucR family transcriptional regulator, purine catabolism regulatory protein
MSLTVRELLAMRDLGLVLATGSGDLERVVSWVAVSELSDPSPWLEGGEFLLTTGMRLGADPSSCTEYVSHLVDAGVSALGFGIGLSHAEIPTALLSAAEAQGITVLAIPEPVPFVAISRAVSQWLSAQDYEESARAFAAQRELIRSALSASSDMTAILKTLGRHVGGFAVHVDARGVALAGYPHDAVHRADEFRDEVDRLRPRGLLASSAVSTAHEHVVLVPLGVGGAASGFLIVGTARPLHPMDQAVLNLAVSLISWAQSRPLSNATELSALREFLFARAGAERVTASTWSALGVSDASVSLVRLRLAESATPADLDAVLLGLSGEAGSLWVRQGALDLAGVIPAGRTDSLHSLAHPVRSIGVSAPFELGNPVRFSAALEQAERAHRSGDGVVHFERLSGRGFSSLVDAGAAASWAAEYVAGIASSSEAPELLATVRAWLAHHGQVDAAAHELGVHRHTVRHRLRRAESLLERSFEDPSVRADLWFALNSLPEQAIHIG